MVRKIASSVDPCTHRPQVRSGPLPPPRAFSPWQGEQLARKREAPSLTSVGLEAIDLRPAAPVRCTDWASNTAPKDAVAISVPTARNNFVRLYLLACKLSPTLIPAARPIGFAHLQQDNNRAVRLA